MNPRPFVVVFVKSNLPVTSCFRVDNYKVGIIYNFRKRFSDNNNQLNTGMVLSIQL